MTSRTYADYRFRIWNPEERTFERFTFASFSELIDWDASQCRTDNANGSLDIQERDLEGLPLEQWTGLLDKHGVEIFEGDILQEVFVSSEHDGVIGSPLREDFGESGAVEYNSSVGCDNGLFCVRFSRPSGQTAFSRLGVTRWSNGTHRRWRVVGNIHENSELLTNP